MCGVVWLELLDELGTGSASRVSELQDEARQIASTIVASKKTARRE
jgi:hypothetical protein